MNSRPFEEKDLPEISAWFSGLQWPLPPQEDIMPELGIVVEDDKGLLSCGWLYTTGTSLAFLSWTATNPERSFDDQGLAMEKLIESVQGAIKSAGDKIKVVMVLSRSEAFAAKLRKLKFRAKSGFDLCTWVTS